VSRLIPDEVSVNHKIDIDLEKIKTHLRENKERYILGGVFAGITCLMMRDAYSRIGSGISGAAGSGISGAGKSANIQNVVTGKNNTLNSVSYISANRQGPPSWAVRCIESNLIWPSQHQAAVGEGVNESYLSQHLNEKLESANGKHFERLFMVA